MDVYILNESENDDPEMATPGSACFDLAANVTVSLPPGVVTLIPTGLFMVIETGYEGLIRPRSGISSTLTVANSPGTVDCDYRGEIMVKLFNRTDEIYKIFKGDKIAQMGFRKVPIVVFKSMSRETFDKYRTDRGTGGFGSTGR
jgi:dUTP pyrophosphatase